MEQREFIVEQEIVYQRIDRFLSGEGHRPVLARRCRRW